MTKPATPQTGSSAQPAREGNHLPYADAERTRSLMDEAEAFPLEATARNLNWNLLRTFIVIAQERSLTRAANRLLVSQPSISNSLRRLEEQLGMTLLKRGGSNFELTPAGLLLFEESLEIYGHVSRLSSKIVDLSGAVQGTVRLSMASTMPDHLLNDLLYHFHRDYPDVRIQTTVTSSVNAERSVLNKTSSLGLVYMDRFRPDLHYEPVYRVRFGHFCGGRHPLYGRRDLSLDDLQGLDCVSMQTNRLAESSWPTQLSQLRQRLQLRVVAQSFNVSEVKRMVGAGIGIAMFPLHAVAEEEADGRLWRLPPYDELPEAPIHLVINPRCRHTSAEQLFIEALRQRIAGFAPSETVLPLDAAGA